MHRARVGNFCSRARAFSRFLSFLTLDSLPSFIALLKAKNKKELTLSLLLFILGRYYALNKTKNKLKKCKFTTQTNNPEQTTNIVESEQRHTNNPNEILFSVALIAASFMLPFQSVYLLYWSSLPSAVFVFMNYAFYIHIKKLLMRSGDIESNPGPPGEIRVMHVNARSLANKIDVLTAESINFDIMTISETWLSNLDADSSLSVPNFHSPVRLDRPGDRHGGVAIYVRDSLYCKARPDLQVPNLEAVWVETKLDQESLLIGSFYRPPSEPVKYWEMINESVTKASATMLKMVILGDFNTDFLDKPSQHLTNILNVHSLKQLVDFPTRITETTSKCLDLIITQNTQTVLSIIDYPPFCSDHNVPCVILKQPKQTRYSYKRNIYIYSKLDKPKFRTLLQNENWDMILGQHTIDESCELFTNRFSEIIKQCVPTKSVTVRSNDAPWFSPEIRTLINKRNKMHKKAKLTNSTEDWRSFRELRNNVVNLVKTKKIEYYNDLNNKVSDPKLFGQKEWWKLVKQFMKKTGIESDEIPPLNVNGQILYTNQEKANALNYFFIQQGNLINAETDPLPHVERKDTEIREIILKEFEVKKAMTNLNPNKASGPDEINNKMLITAADIISTPLTKYFNRCLSQGKFPQKWKMANVSPIHKKGKKDECNNYRPISLLSCLGKLFERCVHSHLYNFITTNNLITKCQSGFMKGDSTINQLIAIHTNLVENFDKGITTQTVFFDISKAFDRVWHRGLLHKLEATGIRGKLLDWLQDYLTHRSQRVVLKGQSSVDLTVNSGVPQGSVLGPLLFLLYINDIVDNVNSTMKLFADDTSFSLGMENADTRTTTLNTDLKKIDDWAKLWKVQFNESKTKLINTKRGNSIVHNLTFGNHIIEEANCHKHLGITIQGNCKWDNHIENIVRKTSVLINCLRSFKHKLNRKTLETMYKSFILPIFDYADILWDNCTVNQSTLLENMHLDALRTITGTVHGTSHAKLLNESGFCSLKERRKRHKLLYYFRIVNGLCPDYLQNLLPPLVSTHNPYHRRKPLERVIPRFHTETYRNSFILSSTTLWNDLPPHVQEIQSLSQFKRYLRSPDEIPPPYFYLGNRQAQILHCRLRLGMSNLQDDLFKRHLSLITTCSCNYSFETADHLLLHCKNFHHQRNNTIFKLPVNLRTIENLLNGNRNLSLQINEEIFDCVHEFIISTNRF